MFSRYLLLLLLLLSPAIIFGQWDSLPEYSIQTVVVTADRIDNPIANTTSSVSVITRNDLHALPITKFSDAAEFLPGFFVVDQDGAGRNSVISTRGFYGGGEAEYLLVLVDGKPINDLETGLVNWNLVPVNAISSVEVSRGSASPLYGDVALGGVMNIITQKPGSNFSSLSVSGGSYGAIDAGAKFHGLLGGNTPFQLGLSSERTNGCRDHSNWRGSTANASIDLFVNDRSSLRLAADGQWNTMDDPGPLTAGEYRDNPRQSSVYYAADGREERRQNVSLEHRYQTSGTSELSTLLFYSGKQSTVTGTYTTPAQIVTFAPSFAVIGLYDTSMYGDTKQRDLKSNEWGGNLKLTIANGSGDFANRFIAGIDGLYGSLSSTYYAMFHGFETDYMNHAFSRGAMVVDGDAARSKIAFYADIEQRLSDPLTVTLGGRYDALHDSYTGKSPDTSLSASHSAFSCKFGANYRYSEHEGTTGNLYININRSFKAPTLDQLTDQRPIDAALFTPIGPGSYMFIPSPFPPFSNASLSPQTALNYETGVYQSLRFSDAVATEHTLSLYRMDISDEIDFDLTTFHYRNIQQSRHLGLESGNKVRLGSSASLILNYTWTSVRFSDGPNDGHFFKAIPRHVITAGGTCDLAGGFRLALDWNFTRTIYLDDENTSLLPDFNFGNARLSYQTGRYRFFADVRNLLDNSYSSTGYLLYGAAYYLPASGRSLHAGVSFEM